MTDEELKYRIAITLIEGVGDIRAKKLIAYCGGVEAVFFETQKSLSKIPGISRQLAGSIASTKHLMRAEQEATFIRQNDIKATFYLDNDYPYRLRQCYDSPVMLYSKGKFDFNHSKIVGIVGTRTATEYGRSTTEQFVEELCSLNPIVFSGLAYGIDIYAHRACLQNNLATVGVLAHGLDRIYPYAHRKTAEQMQENGGLLTEFLSETIPDRENFPKRNRIVAGMCDALIVVESNRRGGAMITAELANSYNRDVLAVPGRHGDTYSSGCNHLIKTNKAAIIESIDDLKYLMNWEEEKGQSGNKHNYNLTDEEGALVDLLKGTNQLSIDQICDAAQISAGNAASILLQLEFSGIIRSLPGKMYTLAKA